MTAQAISEKEVFTAYRKVDSVKELIELTKLSDDELYKVIGSAARETMSSLKPGATQEVGDYTGKAPFMYRELQTADTFPAVYLDLPQDTTEAGKVVFDQLRASFDRVMCETVSHSPLHGFKQEEMNLGMECLDALSVQYPHIDQRLLKAFVALRAKGHFNACSRW